MTQNLSTVTIGITLIMGILVVESVGGAPTFTPAEQAFIDRTMALSVATLAFGPITTFVSQGISRSGVDLEGP